MGSRRSRGSVVKVPGRSGWWCRWKIPNGEVNGKRKYKVPCRFGGPSKREAEQLSASVDAWRDKGRDFETAWAIARGIDTPASTDATTFKELVALYRAATDGLLDKKASTQVRDGSRLEIAVAAPWAESPVERIDRGNVRAWVHSRLAGGLSRGSANNDLSLLSAVLLWGKSTGIVDDDTTNPFHTARLKKVIRKQFPALDLEEFVAFFRKAEELCPVDACDLLLPAGLIGWRLGDWADLPDEDIDLAYKCKTVRAPRMIVKPRGEKMGATKVGHLSGVVLERVEARLARGLRHPKALAFTQPNGTGWHDPKRINLQITKAMDAITDDTIPGWKKRGDASYMRFTAHALRHTARSIQAELGIPLHVVDAVVGHESRRKTLMSHHYTAVPESVLIAAAETVTTAFRDAYRTQLKKAANG